MESEIDDERSLTAPQCRKMIREYTAQVKTHRQNLEKFRENPVHLQRSTSGLGIKLSIATEPSDH